MMIICSCVNSETIMNGVCTNCGDISDKKALYRHINSIVSKCRDSEEAYKRGHKDGAEACAEKMANQIAAGELLKQAEKLLRKSVDTVKSERGRQAIADADAIFDIRLKWG